MILAATIPELKKKLSRKLIELETAKKQIAFEKKQIKDSKTLLDSQLQAQSILQEVAEQVQNTAHVKIAGLVSKCLSSVFDDPYELRIEFSKKRSKTEAKFVLLRDGERLDPNDSTGGGVIDLASFALRLASLTVKLPKRRRVIVLDEPMKHLSVEYRPQVKQLIELLSKEMKVQFILSTHMKALRSGEIYEV